jgi:hypothetical protein
MLINVFGTILLLSNIVSLQQIGVNCTVLMKDPEENITFLLTDCTEIQQITSKPEFLRIVK